MSFTCMPSWHDVCTSSLHNEYANAASACIIMIWSTCIYIHLQAELLFCRLHLFIMYMPWLHDVRYAMHVSVNRQQFSHVHMLATQRGKARFICWCGALYCTADSASGMHAYKTNYCHQLLGTTYRYVPLGASYRRVPTLPACVRASVRACVLYVSMWVTIQI